MKHLCNHCKYDGLMSCRIGAYQTAVKDEPTRSVEYCSMFLIHMPIGKPCGSCRSLTAPMMEKRCLECLNDKDEWSGEGYESI